MQPQPSRFAWTRKRLWVRLRKLRADSALAAAFQRDTAQARTMEATDPPGALALYRAAIETYMSAIKSALLCLCAAYFNDEPQPSPMRNGGSRRSAKYLPRWSAQRRWRAL